MNPILVGALVSGVGIAIMAIGSITMLFDARKEIKKKDKTIHELEDKNKKLEKDCNISGTTTS